MRIKDVDIVTPLGVRYIGPMPIYDPEEMPLEPPSEAAMEDLLGLILDINGVLASQYPIQEDEIA